METLDTLTSKTCPHYRARIVADPGPVDLDDEAGPPVVSLSWGGHPDHITGHIDKFDITRIGYAWQRYGDAAKTARYLWLGFGAQVQFVRLPTSRQDGYLVVATPEWVAMYGGEGEQAPEQEWIDRNIETAAQDVRWWLDREAYGFCVERHVTGDQVRRYDDDPTTEITTRFDEWEDTDDSCWNILGMDGTKAEATASLETWVRDCTDCEINRQRAIDALTRHQA